MALTLCNNCGKEVNTASVTCPHCGYPIQPEQEQSAQTTEQPVQTTGGQPIEQVQQPILGEMPRQRHEIVPPATMRAAIWISITSIGIILAAIIIYLVALR